MDLGQKLTTIIVILVMIHYHGVLPLSYIIQVDGSRADANNFCRNIGDDPLPWCIISYIIQVDGSRADAHNYCRNIGDDPLPWCITTDGDYFYQYYYEHICAGKSIICKR